MTNLGTLGISILLLFCIRDARASYAHRDENPTSTTAKREISLATRTTGFDYVSKSRIRVSDLQSELVQVPFLTSGRGGRKFHMIRYTDISLKLKANDQESDRMKRVFDVVIDSKSHAVIEITSRSTNKKSGALPEPAPKKLQRALAENGEIWHPLTRPPIMSLLDALTEIYSRGYPNPLYAPEINAVCVAIDNKQMKMKPVWIVVLRGVSFPVMGAPTDSVPLQQRNRIRVVVDATTGEILDGGSAP